MTIGMGRWYKLVLEGSDEVVVYVISEVVNRDKLLQLPRGELGLKLEELATPRKLRIRKS
jgi:hypothetical protein